MKKIILLFLIIMSIFFSSCSDSNIKEKQETMNKTIKKVEEKKQEIGHLSIREFEKEMKNDDVILIDIRTPQEWKSFGVLPGVDRFIVYKGNDDFKEKIKSLDKNKKYLIYCFHGNRTREALNVMKELGFSYAKDLIGGIDGRILAEKKVEKYEK